MSLLLSKYILLRIVPFVLVVLTTILFEASVLLTNTADNITKIVNNTCLLLNVIIYLSFTKKHPLMKSSNKSLKKAITKAITLLLKIVHSKNSMSK